MLVLSALVVPLTLWDGSITRLEGALLALGAVAFTVITLKTARALTDPDFKAEVTDEVQREAGAGSKPKLTLIAVAGLAVLVVGGKVFVDGAVGIAYAVGLSERIVGLTIVAVGTSLPELAASLVAALRGHSALAIGNVVGSNIFNVLLILGGAALLEPIRADFNPMRTELAVLVVFTVAAAIMMRGKRTLSRLEGGVLVAGYVAFLVQLARG